MCDNLDDFNREAKASLIEFKAQCRAELKEKDPKAYRMQIKMDEIVMDCIDHLRKPSPMMKAYLEEEEGEKK